MHTGQENFEVSGKGFNPHEGCVSRAAKQMVTEDAVCEKLKATNTEGGRNYRKLDRVVG
jgi:hypothetical protein